MSAQHRYTLKERILAHVEMMRPYTIFWSGLISLFGASITIGDLPSARVAILVFSIPILGWIAGLYLSDFLDRKLDIIQKPHRPIPSGKIKPMEALIVGSLFAIVGFILTLFLNVMNTVLVFGVAFLVLIYVYVTKSKGIFGNMTRGLITVIAYIFGVLAVNSGNTPFPLYVLLVSFVFFLHDTNSNLVGAIRDIDGDRKGGYKTVPVKYGIKISVYLSFFLSVFWLSLACFLPMHFQFLKPEFYVIIILDILLIIFLHIFLFQSIHHYTREKALMFHEIFVIERIVLVSAFLFGVITLYLAFIIFVSALSFTIAFQFILRKKYEFEEGSTI